MASCPTTPSQIPACGIAAPGSSNLLTYALKALHKEFQLLTWVLFSNLRSRYQILFQQVFESSPVVTHPLATPVEPFKQDASGPVVDPAFLIRAMFPLQTT